MYGDSIFSIGGDSWGFSIAMPGFDLAVSWKFLIGFFSVFAILRVAKLIRSRKR